MTKSIISIIIAGIVTLFLFYGIDKQEKVTCYKLQEQAVEFKDNQAFYITQNEKDMCDAQKININAPVGAPTYE